MTTEETLGAKDEKPSLWRLVLTQMIGEGREDRRRVG